MKPVRRRQAAERDIGVAINYYLSQTSAETANKYIDSLERAIAQIRKQPEIGSLRYSHELNISDLRTWPVKNFPYLIFYMNLPDHVAVFRVLHSRSDIPDWLQK